MKNLFKYPSFFQLESGQTLSELNITYSLYGQESAEKTVWVCHALSGSSDVLEWWPGLFGTDKLFDPAKYRIICANVIGGCYGTSGPKDLESPLEFPLVTIKDMVNAHRLLAKELGIQNVDVLIGASLGGQQALEWAIEDPDFATEIVLIATNAFHSPFARAFNEAQRLALKADSSFGEQGGGLAGLKSARAIAMLSYRSYADFELKQSDFGSRWDDFNAASYLRHQGEKFVGRFNPVSYYLLTKAMDSHDIGRGRGDLSTALNRVKAKTLVVGISSDLLFPLTEQQFIARHIPNADLAELQSVHGHDAFLIEYEKLNAIIRDFHLNEFRQYKTTQLKTKNLILN